MSHNSPASWGPENSTLLTAQLLPLSAIRLTSGPLRDAEQRDLDYVLALDVDRLAAPYRREAGLPELSPGYDNWESEGLDGHIGGHYLSACSLLVASTGDERVRARLHRFLDELEACAQARRDGFLGGVPHGAALADELKAGRIEADLFELNGRWVPLYNLHKTLSGLLDAAVHTAEPRALPLAIGLADWLLGALAHLDDAQVEMLLHTEPGGLVEALVTLAALTGEPRYLETAERLVHHEVLDPLLQGRDDLDGLHANTQIPKVVGYEVLGQVTKNPDLTGAAETFWQHVTHQRTVAIGGNSVREHFHARNDFTSMITDRQGPEGCNTVNMIELSVLQYLRTGRPELVDFVERALYNHVLASQHPQHGGLVYFTPMRPAHYRVYSQPSTSMWCCVGSGIEAHARHGAFLAVRTPATDTRPTSLDVLLYIGADITDETTGLSVQVRPQRLGFGRVTIRVSRTRPHRGASNPLWAARLRLRRPSWSPHASAEVVSGSARLEERDPHWFSIDLAGDGDAHDVIVEIELPAQVSSEALPDGSAWAALVHGPLVLAAGGEREELAGLRAGQARMGHIAAGPLLPLAHTPVLGSVDAAQLHSDGTITVPGWVSTHDGRGAAEQRVELVLRHVAEVHDQRYTVYWPTGEPGARREELRSLDAAAETTGIIDEVASGEQQSESDHHLAGSGALAGREGTLHWRSASGWFSYELHDPRGRGRSLEVRFRDTARNADEVAINGVCFPEASTQQAPQACLDQLYRLPGPFAEAPTTHVIRFTAEAGRCTREVVRVRLLG